MSYAPRSRTREDNSVGFLMVHSCHPAVDAVFFYKPTYLSKTAY